MILEVELRPGPETLDDAVLKFRERSVRDGARLSYVVTALIIGYALATWDEPGRAPILAMAGTGILGTLFVSLLPAPRIVRSRWREPFFLAWSLLYTVLITVLVAFDGGADSVLTATFFLPLVFASLSYPPRSVAFVGAELVVGYLLAAILAGGAQTESVAFFAACLTTASVMGVSQAANHERQRRELALVSRSDPLTGCLNRRGFGERFAAALAGAARHPGRPVGLLVIDLDGLKQVNDTRGHAAGDALLCHVAGTLGAGLRSSDVLARLGGDEFAILLGDADAGSLRATADRLRAALADSAPVSIGIASFPEDGDTAEALHHNADADLYRAKERLAAAVAG